MSMNLKRHYPVLLALLLVLSFFTLALGGERVIAYTTSQNDQADPTSAEGMDYTNTIELFDDSQVHDIQIIMDEEDYQSMITTYQQTGEKDYFHADVVIDGVRINDVGLRLKGNASLQTALGGMGMGMAGRAGAGAGQQFVPGGEGIALPDFDPQNPPQGVDPNTLPNFTPQDPSGGGLPDPPPGMGQGFQGDDGQGFAMPGNGPGNINQQSGETKIPMLIKFDEYVSGQTYQGYSKLSLRTYGITYDEAMLDEPLTNYLFELVGLPATQTAYTGLQVNDDPAKFYVLSEVVDDPLYLARNFSYTDGILYKAEVGSSLTYIDDDPSSYATSFSQETRNNEADMASLIAFARFLTESDDASFENELPQWLDVDSFATYLAINSLVVNNDSIAGMNNNYYLYFDDTLGQFSLLYWDGNESMGGLGMGTSAESDLYFADARGMGAMRSGQNILLQRFLENATFKALFEDKLQYVYAQGFASGALNQKLDEISVLVHSVNPERGLVNIENYDQSVASMRAFLQQRMDYLASTELLGK